MNLRDYQQELDVRVVDEWTRARYVLAVLPTGGGKTVTFAHIVKERNVPTIVLAHRMKLIIQMSVALAREGIRHRIIGPSKLVKLCVRAHVKELKYSLFDPTAKVGVGSVQSIGSYKDTSNWFSQVQLWVQDEAHHVLRDNQFGKALARFPNAFGLGVTATPERADGKGLGAHSDGIFQSMVVGPSAAELMRRGFLSDYRLFAPPSNLNLSDVTVGANGEFNADALKEATRRSTVIGDCVEHYVKNAMGMLGLTFADSIENATIIAQKYREAGVPAEVLTGYTAAELQVHTIEQFERRHILQIVSVALIDEGFDCPGIEVISDAAATESLGRYLQRFGRGLRVLAGKERLLYFDHVNNWVRHKLPDTPRVWTLDRRERRAKKKDDAIPLTSCVACLQVYERIYKHCPWCDHYEPPAAGNRTSAEFVDGDLTEIDPATLRAMRGEIERIDGDFKAPYGMPLHVQMHARTTHQKRQEAQAPLRNAIAWWAGLERKLGHPESESYRRFFFQFGTDVATAQTLGAREAGELCATINAELGRLGIDACVNTESL